MTSAPIGLDFQVSKQDVHRHRFVETEIAEPEPGEVLLAVDRFSFTANNITYVMAGEIMIR